MQDSIFKYAQTWNQSPLDQFIIRDLFSIKGDLLSNKQVSLTNIGLYWLITTFIILCIIY